MTEGVEISDQLIITMLGEKETYKYLEILKTDSIKQVEMKEKEYLRNTRKLLETKFYCRKHDKRINTWALSPRKILETILQVVERITQTSGPDNKKTNDHA